MVECNYIIKREINGFMHEIRLDRSEVSAIWVFYGDLLAEELIINKLAADYGVKDFTLFVDVISDLLHHYNKSISYGCDEEHSLMFAFEEAHEALEAALEDYKKLED
jgi:hypothetical protein